MAGVWNRLLEALSGTQKAKQRTKHSNRRKLRIESLENRKLMAIDLASISGTAFVDLTGNGLTADDTRISGVTVQLFRDTNGNGVFNSGVDTLIGSTTTATGTGNYTFAGPAAGGSSANLSANSLTAGNYFVVQGSATGFTAPGPQLVTITAANVAGTAVQMIDPFSTTAQSVTANGTTTTANSSVAATEVVGGERDIQVVFTSGIQDLEVEVIPSSDTLAFSSGLDVIGTALLQYDGNDGTAASLSATGLGGISLNSSNPNAGIQLSTRGDQSGATAQIRVYSSATNFSTANITIPNQSSPENFFVRFSDFVVGGGTGANFNSVGAIEVFINGVEELQAVVTVVQSLRPSVVTANLENQAPSIGVVKVTNTVDANTPPGPFLPVGSTATFTYTVTSTGGTSLRNVVLTDDNGTPGSTSDDFTVTLASGDTNSNSILEPTETWTYTATRVVTAGQYTNIARVVAEDLSGNSVSDTDPSSHFGVNAGINVVKSTNGQDANTTPGVFIAVGGTATFTYVVTNTGNVPLASVVLRDDNGTPSNTSDDFTLSSPSGDTNSNGRLDVNETWTYTSNPGNNRTVTAGQYTNTASVSANPVDTSGADIPGLADVTDTDVSNHFGVNANINVVKSVNGQDANSATGPLIGVGSNATFTYVVTTSGNVALGSVTVVDNNGTPSNTADDFTLSSPTGDTNGNNRLDINETWTYTATRTAVAGQYTNIATATGNPVDSSGADIPSLSDVTDTDSANYFGVTAGVNIVKSVNGNDANSATGPSLLVGTNATFTYVVTNTGSAALGSVVVRDDNGTSSNTSDDFTLTNPTGDTNSNGRLDTNETWTYTTTRTVVSGQYTNVGSVTGNPVDSTGADIPGLADATDTDNANYFGVTAGINVVKSTNGQDANTATGPFLAVGSIATFTYVVTNTGTTSLATVVLRDDNGTPSNTTDDFTLSNPSGDTNGNSRLDPTETWTYTSAPGNNRTVTAGQYTNNATVTANPVDSTGTDIPGIADVTDTDPSNHFGVFAGINVVKSTNGQDANTGPGPSLTIGSTATFTYVVTNTGNSPLAAVVVRDDNGTPSNTADDFNATFVSGDTNGNGRLEPNETWTYRATRVVTTGLYTNLATASGNPVDNAGNDIAGLADPTDTDPSNHTGVAIFSKRRFLASTS